MSTTHNQDVSTVPHRDADTIILRPRTRPSAQCLRHRVWMAACDDCRSARSAQVTKPDEEASAA